MSENVMQLPVKVAVPWQNADAICSNCEGEIQMIAIVKIKSGTAITGDNDFDLSILNVDFDTEVEEIISRHKCKDTPFR